MSYEDDLINVSEQDEEFLEAISTLPEGKKNIIIAYMKDKCDAISEHCRSVEKIQEALEAAFDEVKITPVPMGLWGKFVTKLKKELKIK